MAVRYFIRYFDVVDIEHRLDIYDDTYNDQPQQIDGRITLTYSDTDDPLESVRGQGLSVELEADETLTFNDLWSEGEKTFKTIYKRDDVILFQGWLNPEGFFENWVTTNWMVTFDCVDGLGYLKDLSFVEEETGLPITGRKKYIEILAIALQRTGLALPIYTDIQIRYTGLSDTLDVLNNVYANTERYVKDDGDTIMDCDEVIRDILEPFGAVLTSFNGAWYIYKPNQLYFNADPLFYTYTYLGVSQIETNLLNTGLTIGSDINGFSPNHCSANQSIRNNSSIGAYRINYKYGLAKDLLNNKNLFSSDGVNINGWNILQPSEVTLPGSGLSGVSLSMSTLFSSPEVLRSEDINVLFNTELNIIVNFKPIDINYTISDNFSFIIRLEGDLNNYSYSYVTKEWLLDTSGEVRYYKDLVDNTDLLINIFTNPLPESGNVSITIFQPFASNGIGSVFLSEVSLINISETPLDLKGEFHTVQRTTKPSAKVENTKEVATGDNEADIYEGTIYKTNSLTPTDFWSRKGFELTDIDKPLLQIMGEETLRMSQLPARVFSGSVFGYYNYLSVITIDGLSGVYMPIKYNYDTKNNIITSDFRQIYGDELVDIDYKKTFDYGNTVKPTII